MSETPSRIEDLLARLESTEPSDRIAAIRELKVYDDPRAEAAIEKARRDSDRVVRMVAERARDERLERDGPTHSNRFEDGLLVSFDAASAVERTARRGQDAAIASVVQLGGLLYALAGGAAASAAGLLWLEDQGALPLAVPSLPDARALFVRVARIEPDPVSLALTVALGGLATLAGLGVVLQREWGRRATTLFHAAVLLLGLSLPGVAWKVAPLAWMAIAVYVLSRRNVARRFR